jgi:hypothetical protein
LFIAKLKPDGQRLQPEMPFGEMARGLDRRKDHREDSFAAAFCYVALNAEQPIS